MKEALEILFDKFGIKKKTIRDQNAEFFFKPTMGFQKLAVLNGHQY